MAVAASTTEIFNHPEQEHMEELTASLDGDVVVCSYSPLSDWAIVYRLHGHTGMRPGNANVWHAPHLRHDDNSRYAHAAALTVDTKRCVVLSCAKEGFAVTSIVRVWDIEETASTNFIPVRVVRRFEPVLAVHGALKAADVDNVALSHDGKYLVCTHRFDVPHPSENPYMTIWALEPSPPQCIVRLTMGHRANISRAVFTPDDLFVVSVDEGGGIYVWAWANPRWPDDRVPHINVGETCGERNYAASIGFIEDVDVCMNPLFHGYRIVTASRVPQMRDTPPFSRVAVWTFDRDFRVHGDIWNRKYIDHFAAYAERPRVVDNPRGDSLCVAFIKLNRQVCVDVLQELYFFDTETGTQVSAPVVHQRPVQRIWEDWNNSTSQHSTIILLGERNVERLNV